MELSSDLISQFIKATKKEAPTSKETTVYGTVVHSDGRAYVHLDGSPEGLLTPVTTTINVKDDERVMVMMKNHTATVIGNLTTEGLPARTDEVEAVSKQVTEFEVVIADKVSTEELLAEQGRIDALISDNAQIREKLTATEADIGELEADNVTIKEKLTANEAEITRVDAEVVKANTAILERATIDELEALSGEFHELESTYAEFESATVTRLTAVDAQIEQLDANKLSAEDADIKYANIDFSNISKATMEWFYAHSGLIENVVVGDGTITGNLVGVTIKGDLIEGNTIVADKLVIKGDDGLYYKLNTEGGATVSEEITEEELQNGLSGSVIIAKSITAEKVAVDDLVAFDATIGGFHITDNAIYSGVKETVENTTKGVYLDSNGQMAIGDGDNYIKYYLDQNGSYKLAISTVDKLQIGARNLIRNSTNLIFEDYYFTE